MFMKITVVYSRDSHKAYEIAADTFASLAREVSGAECRVLTDVEYKEAHGAEDFFVLIGSDAANPITASLYLSKKTDGFNIRYCTDDYCIRTVSADGEDFLILAGGRPRAALYAVYRYFELFLGCRWFWDGDRIKKGALVTGGIDISESPRFDYRGLRYFAHRGLHRFQAEHWGFDDWKNEIDWMLKKRLNLFMLRIGLDDIFQKAFPDTVSYPERDETPREAGKGFDDRTLFWSLEYRGELRKRLLGYAFERDLMHPEDCGTMTHWYSRTPYEFLEKKAPKMLPQYTSFYAEPTGLVWDVRENENLVNYFKLTEAHVKAYGKPELFHTIGLGERLYSSDPEENRRMKLYVYRRIASYIKENYPNSPLLIASWDLWMRFTPEEVRELVGELDPSQSVILDYTSDTVRENNFTKWGICGRFPWIFGVFGAYEPESDIRGDYGYINERLELAKADPFCKGMILWPELSHGDPLMAEYLAVNSWDGNTAEIAEFIEKYCEDRYCEGSVSGMKAVWHEFLPIISLTAWNTDDSIRQSGSLIFPRLAQGADFDKSKVEIYRHDLGERLAYIGTAAEVLSRLSEIEAEDAQMKRDMTDIARTVIGRFTDAFLLAAELDFAENGVGAKTVSLLERARGLLRCLRDLLATHNDFSLYESLRLLQAETDTNPNFERTLKNNAECEYCRSYVYENAEYLYLPELDIIIGELSGAYSEGREINSKAILSHIEENKRRYFETPLAKMDDEKPKAVFSEICKSACGILKDSI